MRPPILHLAVFLSSLPFVISDDGPLLKTHIGTFEGKTLEFGEAGNVDAFYGVPYAKPPLAERRFEKPAEAEFVARRPAVEPKLACPQTTVAIFPPQETSEDCLYLDVFKPPTPSEDGKGRPLLVFVHGGGFQGGSAHHHSTPFFAKTIAGNGAVLINVQYRLGVLGFASTGPESFPGNYGLWDLRKALLWIRKNAKELDVDPKRITLGGYSAGSAAVGMLTISEQTRDLFQQAIQMSGSPFAEWATSNKAVLLTEKVATHLGCNEQSSTEVKRCLKKKTVKELLDAFEVVRDPNDFNLGQFSPRLDADFFTADYPQLIESGPPKRSLFTITENEGILFTLHGSMNMFNEHSLTEEQKANFGAKDFKEFVRTKLATEAIFSEKAADVQKKLLKFYLDSDDRQKDRHFYLEQYAKLISDILFVVPQLLEVRHKTASGWPIFMTKHTHHVPMIDFSTGQLATHSLKDSTHGCEYGLLFGTNFNSLNNSKEDEQTPKTADSPHFAEVTAKRPLVYSEIGAEIRLRDGLFAAELQFYDRLNKDHEFDLIRGIHKKTLRSRTEL
ncbi:Carboxylic ester hydrolase [Aphelenchoides fujianensis]|nr:Carboxylic ester hydrolase [Aphelenchoides fujianensis]